MQCFCPLYLPFSCKFNSLFFMEQVNHIAIDMLNALKIQRYRLTVQKSLPVKEFVHRHRRSFHYLSCNTTPTSISVIVIGLCKAVVPTCQLLPIIYKNMCCCSSGIQISKLLVRFSYRVGT